VVAVSLKKKSAAVSDDASPSAESSLEHPAAISASRASASRAREVNER